MALFGFTRLSATPTLPLTALTIQVEDTSEWPTAPFNLLIRRPNVRPRGSTAEVVTVSSYTGGGAVTLSSRAVLAGGTQTVALAIRKGYECYPLSIDSFEDGFIHNGSGVGYAMTRAGLQAAIDALPSTGGRVTIPAGSVVWDNTPVLVSKSNVDIGGAGPATILKSAANSTSTDLIQVSANSTPNSPLIGTGRLLNASPAIGQNVLVLAGGSVAAMGLVQYDYIVITDPTGTTLSQVTQVLGISGQTLTLADPLKETFTTGNGTIVAKFTTPVVNVHIHDLMCDGNGNTGATSCGLVFTTTIRCGVSNIWGKQMPQSVVYGDTNYTFFARNINMERCGSDQVAALEWFRTSMSSVSDYKQVNGPSAGASGGFGLGMNFCNGVQIVNAVCTFSHGRGFKVYFGSDVQLTNCKSDTAIEGQTGFLLTGHDIDAFNCHAWNNVYGIEVIGDNNHIIGGSFRYNGLDVWIVSGTGSSLDGATYATLTDGGTKTSWTGPWVAYTPTVTQSGAVSTFSANGSRWQRVGNTVNFIVHLVVNNAGAVAGANDIVVSLPTAALVGVFAYQVGVGQIYDSNVTTPYRATAELVSSTTLKLAPTNVATLGYLGSLQLTAALATGDFIDIVGSYEAA